MTPMLQRLTRTMLHAVVLSGLMEVPVCSANLPKPDLDSRRPMKLHRILNPDGTPVNKDWFPLAVWLQDPKNARRYQDIGVNLFVGLWKGPTEEHLAALKKVGVPVICGMNDVGLRHIDDPIIAGWMHGDEPDNAQAKPDGQPGWDPPIPPAKIIADYKMMKQKDPSRPVLLNLGQGVAWDGWYGRGTRTNHPEDYAEYAKGGDIISFDIYPVVHDHQDVRGKLEFVPNGVKRLKSWAPKKVIWNCIEASRIDNEKVKPTPDQIRKEVMDSIAAGSRGLIYFVHQFKPTFIEASLLEDPELRSAIAALNRDLAARGPGLSAR